MSDIKKLQEAVTGLVIIEPSADSVEVVNESQLAPLRASKAALVAQGRAIKVDSPEAFALADEWLKGCEAFVAAVKDRFEEPISQANRRHKALTGTRALLIGNSDDPNDVLGLIKYLRDGRGEYKAAVERAEREAREAAERKAREEAEARQREAARIAREEAERQAAAAAEARRIADEQAAEAKRVADAEAARLAAEAALIEDADAAMEAAAAAEEAAAAAAQAQADAAAAAAAAEEEANERAIQAALDAEAAAAAPVVVPSVHVQPVLEKEDGVSWADNWVAKYDPVEAFDAIIKARAWGYLMLNEKAISAAAKSQKGLARIPGVSVVNEKIERRKR